jgi:tetrahydromethanopterin S-methyltransferase subunit B
MEGTCKTSKTYVDLLPEVNGGFIMVGYLTDLLIVTVLVVGITALMGVILNGIGEKVFGGKNKNEFVDQSARFQTGWKMVGGNRK